MYALKPLSESLSTIDSTTAGAARDLSNHIWESGGRHQAMETTLSGVHGMVRDLQNRVGTTQRKLDDWVKSWSDSSGTTVDDSPGVVKCLCQLREHQDELARYNQANEALSSKVDSVAEAVGVIATRVQNMQTLLDKMAAARPKAPPPAFPAPDIPASESAGPPPHQPPGSWHPAARLCARQPLAGPARAPPHHAAGIHPLHRSHDPSGTRCSPGSAVRSQRDQSQSSCATGHCHRVDGRPCFPDPHNNGPGDQLKFGNLLHCFWALAFGPAPCNICTAWSLYAPPERDSFATP